MKKTVILIAVLLVLALQAQPQVTTVNLPDKITVDDKTGSTTTQARIVEKVNDQTGTITTTTTTTQVVIQVEFDRAVLQTEKDHNISDYIPEAQAKLDALIARNAEIDEILSVFK